MNKNNIKNKFFLLCSLVFLIAGLTSCDKEITDLQPYDRITELAAFESPAKVELSMVGVYDAAQSGFYPNGQRGYPFGAANVEQGDMRGEDMLNVATFYAITYESTYNSTTANNVFMWNNLYGVINKANIVIEGVRTAAINGVITEEAANAYEGEARFLRALSHHELLVHFARPYNHTADASHEGVFYRELAVNTTPNLDIEVASPRLSVAECYEKLLADLDFAETNLPASRSGYLTITRATSGAAVALKSRVQLHKGDWAATITEGEKLINGTMYSLTDSPDGVFASNNNNTESIFSIENAPADNPGVNGSLPSMYSVVPGRALIAISPILYNATWWTENDLRRTLLVDEAANGFFSNKYRDVATQSDYNPIIRLAEVILNVSEAHARQGNTGEALELLNMVRNRAVVDESEQFDEGSFGNANELIEAILRERRIEFYSEGRRWADIHRLANDPVFSTGGIPAKVSFGNVKKEDGDWGFGVNVDADGNYNGSKSIPARPYDDHRFIWPLPIDEINNNPGGEDIQNPGY